MAMPISIRDLLRARRVESTRIEYKANWNPEKVLHSICAVANDIDNTGGGYIVLGVAEELELVEGRNTGIPTIVGAMRENGSPDPIFLTDDDRSYFTVVLPAHAVAKAGNDPKTGGDNRGDNRGDNLLDGLPVEQRKICEILLADDHVSIRKIAELLGIRKNTVDKQLTALKNKGMVRREGGTRGVWRVRCKEA